jgi:GGDEF domain-containing protein
VADAPIDALLVAAEDLAKGWLLALLEQSPLEAAPGILAADLARDGPRVCDAVVRALADDADLRRVEQGGALEPLVSRAAEFAGAGDAEAASRAVDALHAVIWSGLRAELPGPDADQISELSERLTLVTGLVRAAVLRRGAGSARAAGPGPAVPHEDPPPNDQARAERPVSLRVASSASAPVAGVPPTGEVLWVEAVKDEIAGALRSGSALSLLLAELEEADKVLAVEPESGSGATFGRFAQAVRAAVRRKDILVCETEARAWIIATDTARPGAYALARRVADAVRVGERWHGAPMTATVGVAVLREDGLDPDSLIEAAEEARFAASASGLAVMPASEEPPGSEGPNGGVNPPGAS